MQEQALAQVENFITGRDFEFSMRWRTMSRRRHFVALRCRLSKCDLFHLTRNMQ